MEQFLEVILQAEKEAGNIEEQATHTLADVEREYCLALAQSEANSLKELYQNLAKEKKQQTGETTRLGDEIAETSKKEAIILENTKRKIEDNSIELVINTLLPDLE